MIEPYVHVGFFVDTEDWEQRRAEAIFETVSEKNFPNLPVLSASQEDGMVFRDFLNKRIVHDADSHNTYKRVVPGNFVIHLRSFQGGFAYSTIEGITSPAYTVLKFKQANRDHDIFWKNILVSRKFIKKLESITYGIRDGRSISFEEFKPTTFFVPNKYEQNAIADFIKKVDQTITIHRRKCEDLKELKKGLLQKMFPREGEEYPEVGFPGFTDAWKQRKLGELYQRNNERNIEQFGPEKTISIATMTVKSDGNGAAEESIQNYKVLKVGDIAFEGHTNKEFRFGRFVLNDVENGIMSPRFTSLRPIREMPLFFWKQYINFEPMMRRLLVNATKSGTMMNELVVPEALEQLLFVPDGQEQQQIGTFFSTLDRTITLHQRKSQTN